MSVYSKAARNIAQAKVEFSCLAIQYVSRKSKNIPLELITRTPYWEVPEIARYILQFQKPAQSGMMCTAYRFSRKVKALPLRCRRDVRVLMLLLMHEIAKTETE